MFKKRKPKTTSHKAGTPPENPSGLRTVNNPRRVTRKSRGGATFFFLTILIGAVLGAATGFLSSEISNQGLRERLTELEGRLGITKTDFGERGSNGRSAGVATLGLIEEESATIEAVGKASPAVVSIVVTKDIPRLDPFSNDPFFDPFGFHSFPGPQDDPETEKREIGGGTGFIVGADGYIITNRHVVDDQEADYTVITTEGERIEAEVLARDSFMDLAVLKVDKEGMPTIEMGNSDGLQLGQSVVAIGNSLGEFQNTVSKGVISGLKRNLSVGGFSQQRGFLDKVIQTDAAINPGNSGGPIVNLTGQAVGVNVAMAFGAENIGFAIPINEAKLVYESVRETGKIIRPQLGVRYVPNNEILQEDLDLDFDHGAIVARGPGRGQVAVVPGSPADEAGIQQDDIILEVDGAQVNKENDLGGLIKRKSVGEEVELKIWRDGEKETVKVTLEGVESSERNEEEGE